MLERIEACVAALPDEGGAVGGIRGARSGLKPVNRARMGEETPEIHEGD